MVDDSFSDPTRETVRRLLIAPVESSQSIHVEQSGRELGSDWKTTVWSFWHARLRDRWPFQRSADPDAEFQDFVQFFEPGKGILWGFVAKNLSNKIEWKGSRFVAKDDEESHLTSSAFGCLNAAKEITDAFFPPNGSPGLRFDVMGAWTQTDATEIKLLVGPKTAFPLTRDQWIHATWFGETDVHVSWVQPGFQKTEEGHRSFALFNLFRTVGGLSHLGSGVYGTPYAALGIKVRAASGVDAFAPNFFTKLSCPDTIHRSARERRTN
jgi:type VI protein secretion system component VasK